MKIKYEFVTETVEVEVSAEIAELIKECDREEYNNNHKETRRHTTLDNGVDDYEWLSCDDYNPITITETELEAKKIRDAFSTLTEAQKDLIQKVFIEGMSINDYANLCNVDQSAVSHRIKTIRNKLKKLI